MMNSIAKNHQRALQTCSNYGKDVTVQGIVAKLDTSFYRCRPFAPIELGTLGSLNTKSKTIFLRIVSRLVVYSPDGVRGPPPLPAIRSKIHHSFGHYLAGRSRRNSSAVSRREEVVDLGHVDVDLRIDQNPLRSQRSQLKFRFGRMGPVTKTFRRMALPGIFRELAALCRSAIAQPPFDAIEQMPCIRGAVIWQALHLRRSPCCCTNSAKLSNATNPFWFLCLRIAGHPRR